MKKNSVRNCVSVALMVIASVVLFSASVLRTSAAEMVTGPLVVVDKYEVTGERIVPGEDFTLTLTISNYNQTTAAKDVLIDIDNPVGVAPVYGTVSQVYVGDIAPGETKEISLDYNSWTSVTGDTLDFYVTIVTSVNQNYIVLRIPVGSDSPFSIISTNIPEVIGVDEILSVSLAFQVLGEENVRDVAMVMSSDGAVLADSSIGIVTPGATITQQLSTFFNEPGEYVLEMGLEYVDSTGQKLLVPVETKVIEVHEANNLMNQDIVIGTDDNNSNGGVDTVLLMGVSGVLILAIFLIVIIIMRKNK